jgi:predicted NAD-dependent protein-ADP-ribosyltransferase YbiA (DUF1768 family)
MSASDIFQFFHKSADAAPGKGTGETVTDPKAYAELAKVKGWRKMLSNFAETPFTWKGLQWKTVEHAFHAAKFETLNPEVFRRFSLTSGDPASVAGGDTLRGSAAGDPIGQGGGEVARASRKIIVLTPTQQKAWAERRDGVLSELWSAKFSQNPEARRILLLTHPAQLWHQAPRGPKEHWSGLEILREEMRGEAQRNEAPQAEMADAAKPAKKKGGRPKKAAAAEPPALEEAGGAGAAPPVAAVPEAVVADGALLALAGAGPLGPPEGLDDPEEKQSAVRFCPVCKYYLYLQVTPRDAASATGGGEEQSTSLVRLCRNCGFKEEDTKGGLVMEMMVKERAAESYKILLNEFTRRDPRLPHIRGSIKCPDPACESNSGAVPSDVIYIKHDPVNLLYLYICDVCGVTWRSRRSG